MAEFGSVDGVLDFAMAREDEAFAFYTRLAGQVQRGDLQELFRQLAEEEKGHKAKLDGVKQGKLLLPAERQVLDMKMSDYLVPAQPGEKLSYQEALILAMKKEKASFKLYSDLAARAPTPDLANTFRALAQEEARHKLRFEIEYDKEVLEEN
jgi:rubrerythrin